MREVRILAIIYLLVACAAFGLALATDAYLDFDTSVLKSFSGFAVAVVLVFSFLLYGAFDLRMLFNFTYVFFLFGAIFLSFVYPVELEAVESITNTSFEPANFDESLALSAFPLFVINLAFLLTPSRERSAVERRGLQSDLNLFAMGTAFFWIGLPVYLWKGVSVAQYAVTHGYAAFYRTGLDEIVEFPLLVQLGTTLFSLGFFLVLASVPPRWKLFRYLVVYFLAVLIDSLKGNRGLIFLVPLYSIWYWAFFYGLKPGVRVYVRTAALAIVLVFAANALLAKRTGLEEGVQIAVPAFVLSASTTNRVINVYLEYRGRLPTTRIGYIFEPLVFPMNYVRYRHILSHGQSEETVQIRENLNHRLTYAVNPGYYLVGGGLGSSFVLEMYEFGVLGLCLFGVLFAVLLDRYLACLMYSRLAVFSSFLIVTHVLMMPRAEFFPGVWSLTKFGVLYFVATLAVHRLRMAGHPSESRALG